MNGKSVAGFSFQRTSVENIAAKYVNQKQWKRREMKRDRFAGDVKMPQAVVHGADSYSQ